jgi:hypothetical protein
MPSDLGLPEETSNQLLGEGNLKEESDGSENDWILNWASDRSSASNSAHDKIAGILAEHSRVHTRQTFTNPNNPAPLTKVGLANVNLCDDDSDSIVENHTAASRDPKQTATNNGGPETSKPPRTDAGLGVAPVKSLNPYESIQAMVATKEKSQGRSSRDVCRMSLMKLQLVKAPTTSKVDRLNYNPLSTIRQGTSDVEGRTRVDVFGRCVRSTWGDWDDRMYFYLPRLCQPHFRISLSLSLSLNSKISEHSAARTLLYQSRQLPKGIKAR